jgi:hypothetical protein
MDYPNDLICDIIENEEDRGFDYPPDIVQTMNYLVECLPAQEREAIVLFYRQGASFDMIRKVAKIPEKVPVLDVINRGVSKLRSERNRRLLEYGIGALIDGSLLQNPINDITKMEFTKKMQQLYDEYKDYPEACHSEMDEAMEKLLEELGFGDGVKIFEKADRWYS